MDIAIFIRNEKPNVFLPGLTVRNDRLNDKEKSVNSLLKRRCDKEKYVLPTTQTLKAFFFQKKH